METLNRSWGFSKEIIQKLHFEQKNSTLFSILIITLFSTLVSRMESQHICFKTYKIETNSSGDASNTIVQLFHHSLFSGSSVKESRDNLPGSPPEAERGLLLAHLVHVEINLVPDAHLVIPANALLGDDLDSGLDGHLAEALGADRNLATPDVPGDISPAAAPHSLEVKTVDSVLEIRPIGIETDVPRTRLEPEGERSKASRRAAATRLARAVTNGQCCQLLNDVFELLIGRLRPGQAAAGQPRRNSLRNRFSTSNINTTLPQTADSWHDKLGLQSERFNSWTLPGRDAEVDKHGQPAGGDHNKLQLSKAAAVVLAQFLRARPDSDSLEIRESRSSSSKGSVKRRCIFKCKMISLTR